jgi:hypothetical protein
MSKGLRAARLLGLSATVVGMTAMPAQAALRTLVPVDTSWCQAPSLTQPFTGAGDANLYALAPGQDVNSFSGAGWTLSGGATVVTATLADGTTGSVLDMPSGSTAVSPPMCVTSGYVTARTMQRTVKRGGALNFYVAYQGRKSWADPRRTTRMPGVGAGWAPSANANMAPFAMGGWQVVEIELVASGRASEFQIYNVFIDPRMAR